MQQPQHQPSSQTTRLAAAGKMHSATVSVNSQENSSTRCKEALKMQSRILGLGQAAYLRLSRWPVFVFDVPCLSFFCIFSDVDAA